MGLIEEHNAAEAGRAATLALFEPKSEIRFSDLIRLIQICSTEVRVFQGGASVLMRSGRRWFNVWDNGGEVGVEILEPVAPGQVLADFFPLSVCRGLIDPWDVWCCIQDTVCRQELGESGRGGDAPFPLPTDASA